MMYDYGTDNFLRNEIANAERYRTELEIKLAGYRTNVQQAETKIEALNTRITDLARLLDFHERYQAEQAAPAPDVNAARTTLAEQLRAVGAEQAARVVEGAPACARCKVPFDSEDKSYTGSARHDDTPYCMGCVDNCHEAGADHRCIICVPRVAESGS